MADQHVRTKQIPATSSIPLIARIVNSITGDPILPAEISTVALRVVDLKAETGVNVAIGDSDDVIKALTPWSKDATGYNFIYHAGGAQIPLGDRVYQYQFTLTPTDVEVLPFKLFFDVPTETLVAP